MSEPLIPISPNTVRQDSPQRQSSTERFKGSSPNMSSEGSDYSIIDYNVPTATSVLSSSTTFTRTVEKHSRSTTNSPQKVLKKPKYQAEMEDEDDLMDQDDVFGRHDENHKEDNMTFDADLTGFSQATFSAVGSDARINFNDDNGENTVSRQILGESFRRDRDKESPSKTPAPKTPTRDRFTSPPGSSNTQESVTPRGNPSPSRLAALSQYSKSPDSTPSRTPERTTNLLLDFTQQFNNVRAFPHGSATTRSRRSQSVSPTKGLRSRVDEAGSPTRHPLPTVTPRENRFLLDFDIPPPPTPRSIPSITPKELESLKSTYLAQIASLKAEVSGKDAEIGGLKHAIQDAERRCAHTKSELREIREEAEDLNARNGMLESKLQEASKMITEAREQIGNHSHELDQARNDYEAIQREYENSQAQLNEIKQDRLEVERELATVKQDLILEQSRKASGTMSNTSSSSIDVGAAVSKAVAAATASKETEITAAVEKVAKELHTLYKSKHEQKVTALKSSYATRWEKRVKELETRNQELASANNNLSGQLRRAEEEKEEHLTGPMVSPHPQADNSEEMEKLENALEEARNLIERLKKEVEAERDEKGELVLAVDELLALGGAPSVSEAGMENLRGSINRVSAVGIAKALNSPMKTDPRNRGDSEWKTSSLRGGIERMGGGGAGSKFGLGGAR